MFGNCQFDPVVDILPLKRSMPQVLQCSHWIMPSQLLFEDKLSSGRDCNLLQTCFCNEGLFGKYFSANLVLIIDFYLGAVAVAQRLECRPTNLEAVGSNPARCCFFLLLSFPKLPEAKLP